jgi:hypothetical protein
MRRELALVFALGTCTGPADPVAPPGPEPEVLPVRELSDARAALAALRPRNRDVTYRAASIEEKAALADVIAALWVGDDAEARARARPLARHGLALEAWRVAGRRYWVVRERDDARRGAGAYAVRDGVAGTRPVLLQAPHAYFDLGTGAIAAELFFETAGVGRALFVNTVQRYQTVPGVRVADPDSPADVCHNPDHLFAAATAAALRAGVARLIQLHGFEGEADEPGRGAAGAAEPARAADGDADGARMIVSSGRARSSPGSAAVAAALGGPAARVLRFPEETRRLGATTNVQARLAEAAGADFVHVEMSRDVRDRLLADPRALRDLAAAIEAGLPGGGAR